MPCANPMPAGRRAPVPQSPLAPRPVALYAGRWRMFGSVRCFAVAWLLAAAALPAWGGVRERPVEPEGRPLEWTIDGETFEGRLVVGDGLHGKVPGLVMVPNWMGVTDESIARAREIAGN